MSERERILKRRARFIAAALGGAGIGVACASQPNPPPEPCLSQPCENCNGPEEDAGQAVPCLSVQPDEDGDDAGGALVLEPGDERFAQPPPDEPPRPCLSPVEMKEQP